jgi:hypothetical protein
MEDLLSAGGGIEGPGKRKPETTEKPLKGPFSF